MISSIKRGDTGSDLRGVTCDRLRGHGRRRLGSHVRNTFTGTRGDGSGLERFSYQPVGAGTVVRAKRQETSEIGRDSVRLFQSPKAVRRVASCLVRNARAPGGPKVCRSNRVERKASPTAWPRAARIAREPHAAPSLVRGCVVKGCAILGCEGSRSAFHVSRC